jgi:hypothetical protein
MSNFSSEHTDAVFFFSGGEIVRELLYPEFEAILDGFIPFPDAANTSAKAVYIRVGADLNIVGTVFFLLGFDAKGMADRRWNVPLEQLLESAGRGPDLGAGPIGLVCYSQCPIPWQQKNLWDPILEGATNSFQLLRHAVKTNRIGLTRKAAARHIDPPVLADTYDEVSIPTLNVPASFDSPLNSPSIKQVIANLKESAYKREVNLKKEWESRIAKLVKEHELLLATTSNQTKEKMNELQLAHQQRLQAYQQKIQKLESQQQELEERNRLLKENLDVQANKVEGMREYFSHKLKAAQDESSQIQALQENFTLELEMKIQSATAELREMLEMREVELFYRHQNESTLKEEIVNLKQENQTLISQGGNHLLHRLSKAGIAFVSFHPGAGEIRIMEDDIGRYLDNPQAYAAEKCGVHESLYQSWLEHYHLPVCRARDAAGQFCGKPLTRIESPLQFHPGENDCCEQHQALSYLRLVEKQ